MLRLSIAMMAVGLLMPAAVHAQLVPFGLMIDREGTNQPLIPPPVLQDMQRTRQMQEAQNQEREQSLENWSPQPIQRTAIADDPSLLTAQPDPLLAASNAAAVDDLSLGIMPFYASIHYGNGSIKDYGNLAGFYTWLYTGSEMWEFNFDYSEIEFNAGFRLVQHSYTVVATDWFEDWKLRYGGHFIDANDNLSGAWVAFAGAHRYEVDQYEVGADVYVSHYEDQVDSGLTVVQFMPRGLFTLDKNEQRTINFQVNAYLIALSDSVNNSDQEFFSGEFKLSRIGKLWDFSAMAWGGTQSFAVRQDGFLVFNLNERHVAGWGAEAKFKPWEHFHAITKIGQEFFTDDLNQTDTNSFVASVLFLLTY